MDTSAEREGWHRFSQYVAGAVIGVLIFVTAPEGFRWLHGGAFAQAPTSGGVDQHNQDGPNVNVPGNGNHINIYPSSPSPPQAAPIAHQAPADPPECPPGTFVCLNANGGSIESVHVDDLHKCGGGRILGVASKNGGIIKDVTANNTQEDCGPPPTPVINNGPSINTTNQSGGSNTIITEPPRRPFGLYQAGQMVGSVSDATPGPFPGQITFQNLRITSGTVDTSSPFAPFTKMAIAKR